MFFYSFLMASWPREGFFFFLTRGEGAELRNAFNPLDYKQFKILLLSLLLVLNPYLSYHSFSRKKLGHIVCSSRSFGGSAVDQWGHLLINMISHGHRKAGGQLGYLLADALCCPQPPSVKLQGVLWPEAEDHHYLLWVLQVKPSRQFLQELLKGRLHKFSMDSLKTM